MLDLLNVKVGDPIIVRMPPGTETDDQSGVVEDIDDKVIRARIEAPEGPQLMAFSRVTGVHELGMSFGTLSMS